MGSVCWTFLDRAGLLKTTFPNAKCFPVKMERGLTQKLDVDHNDS